MSSKLKRSVQATARSLGLTYRTRRAKYRYADFGYRHFIKAPGLESVPSWKRPLDVPALLRQHAIEPRGVIQAGAHKGNEVQVFLDHGFARVLLIEANPDLAEQLRIRFADQPRVTIANAAASDTEGTSTFNIATGDAQSSSILDPTLHKRIYKGIRFQETIEVRTAKIDTLVHEAGFEPADFNMLVMDIQGAEIMALRGATEQLKHTDAVLSEFSNIELYKGSGTLADLRALLSNHALHLAAEEVNWHPTWGDCFFVRKPVIQMSDLGSNGRFANQLFQHAFLHLAAQELGAVVQSPPWVGHELYQLPYAPCKTNDAAADLPVVNEEPQDRGRSNDKALSQVRALLEDHPAVDVQGFFQDMSFLAPHRDELREVFTLAQPWRELVAGVIDQLRSRPGPLIAVHLRRSDFGYNHFYRAPHPWYTAWVDGLPEAGSPASVYICSEDPDPFKPKFTTHPVFSVADFPSVPKAARCFLDFEILRHADHIAISNSSYSFMAAFLNRTEGVMVRPSVKAGGLVPFDPCAGPVLHNEILSREEHERLAKLDAL